MKSPFSNLLSLPLGLLLFIYTSSVQGTTPSAPFLNFLSNPTPPLQSTLQPHPPILFLPSSQDPHGIEARTRHYTIQIRPTSLHLEASSFSESKRVPTLTPLHLQLIHANPNSQAQIENVLPTKIHDLRNFNSTDSSPFPPKQVGTSVRFPKIYPGIDLHYYGNNGYLEYDFILAPNTSADQIRFQFPQDQSFKIHPDKKTLHVTNPKGRFEISSPIAYQWIDQIKHPVEVHFLQINAYEIGFALGDYRKDKELIIDPILLGHHPTPQSEISTPPSNPLHKLTLSAQAANTPSINTDATYLTTLIGGTQADQGWDIALDSQGNAIVVGATQSSHIPSQAPEGVFTNYSGGNFIFDFINHVEGDAFIAKIKPDGSMDFFTYLGGNSSDAAIAVALDANDQIYITGYTASTNFPVFPTNQIFQPHIAGSTNFLVQFYRYDAFVTKLSADGSKIIYSTFLGGDGEDESFDIQVNGAQEALIVGQTASTTASLPPFTDISIQEGSTNGAFIAQLNAAGSALNFFTYLSGNGFDSFESVALSPQGNFWVCGFTSSTDLPTPQATQPTFSGLFDAYYLHLSADGSNLLTGSYLGGTGTDVANRITLNPAGQPLLTGETDSRDFPVSNNALQPTFNGGLNDAFLVAHPTGTTPYYATYLGGPRNDVGWDIQAQPSGRILLLGNSSSPNIASFSTERSLERIDEDFFVLLMNPGATEILWANLLGDIYDDSAYGIASNPNQTELFVVGETFFSLNFPGTEKQVMGTRDAFLTKIQGLPIPPPSAPPVLSVTVMANNQLELSWINHPFTPYHLRMKSTLNAEDPWTILPLQTSGDSLPDSRIRVRIPVETSQNTFYQLTTQAATQQE